MLILKIDNKVDIQNNTTFLVLIDMELFKKDL